MQVLLLIVVGRVVTLLGVNVIREQGLIIIFTVHVACYVRWLQIWHTLMSVEMDRILHTLSISMALLSTTTFD